MTHKHDLPINVDFLTDIVATITYMQLVLMLGIGAYK